MATDLAVRSTGRPGPVRLVATLTAHALRSFARTPVSAFFTLGIAVIVLAAVGNQTIDPAGDLRVAQFVVPAMAVFGVAQAAFCLLAVDAAQLRDQGALKRLRGTPAPAWAILASRISCAVVVALLSVTVLMTVGVAGYGVRIVWRMAPAALVTLVLGIACFAALGLAVVALTRSTAAAQTFTNGLLVPLCFISGVFVTGADLPRWLDVIGDVLPLRHFATALTDTFKPDHAGAGIAWGHWAVLVLWGLAGAAAAWRWFGWEPRRGTHARQPAVPQTTPELTPIVEPAVSTGRPSALSLIGYQIGHALIGQRRDISATFFAIGFPVLMLLMYPVVFGDGMFGGIRLSQHLIPAMITYAIAMAAFVNLPQAVAEARDHGVLTRLRGTPTPPWTYLAGQIAAVAVLSAAAATCVSVTAVVAFDATVDLTRLPALIVAMLAGVVCFTALGFALLAVIRSARAAAAVTLGILLPLSFLSDLFVIGTKTPKVMATIGDLFPLKHLLRALLAATSPNVTGAGFAWQHLAVIAAWTAGALLVARRFTWAR